MLWTIRSVLTRLFFIVVWWFIGLPTLMAACYKGKQKLWSWAYYFDNEEENFDGSKVEWYDNYKGVDIDSLPWYKRAWVSYVWSAWRNMCYNLRYHPWCSVDVTEPVNMTHDGNTYFHNLEWMGDKEKRYTRHYRVVAEYEGKKLASRFWLFHLFSRYYLYVRVGLKIYPRHYFDEYWLGRINKEGWPKYKERGIFVFSIRFKKGY